MKKLILLLSVLAITINCFSKDNAGNIKSEAKTIKGKVVDKETGEALTGVAIKLEGKSSVCFTDFEGNFVIQDVEPGTHELSATMVSYKNETVKVNPKNNNNLSVYIESLSE